MSLKERFELVIFDWAGTMVDFGCEAPVKALIEAFAAEGVAIDAATARRDMGKADIDTLIARLGPLMREHAVRASTLIPGARETFGRLRAADIRWNRDSVAARRRARL